MYIINGTLKFKAKKKILSLPLRKKKKDKKKCSKISLIPNWTVVHETLRKKHASILTMQKLKKANS